MSTISAYASGMNTHSKLVPAKTVTCKRCGDEQVAWVQSKRTGKWYLAQAFRVDGEEVASPLQFHKCSPEGLARVAAKTDAEKAAMAELPDVPEGHYAVATNDGATNELAFYRVDRPTEGKWAGWVFVKHLIGPDERRVPKAQMATILAKIATDPAEASKRYGHEIQRCGVCHRRLTNDDSRAAGIGPKCAADMGW